MDTVSLIRRKRDGFALTADEWRYIACGISQQKIPDYQASALLMAIFLQGLTAKETADLTKAMLESGTQVKLDHIHAPKVDKHSTGGVGDKTSLILAPLVGSFGVKVPMISGRGLGHTGGTLDKLESMKGFSPYLSEEKIVRMIEEHGIVMAAQTESIVPADKKMYALRDTSGSVESIPLICSSIMSKKLAEGIDGLVLDVKVGDGAFMKTRKDAKALADAMCDIGISLGKKVTAILTRMDQPLGSTIGNTVEVYECLAALSGAWWSADLKEVTYALAREMLRLADINATDADLDARIATGVPLEMFQKMVKAQGGTPFIPILNQDALVPDTKIHTYIYTRRPGYVSGIRTFDLAVELNRLGAGRLTQQDKIQHEVGITHMIKLGARVTDTVPLMQLHCNTVPDVNFADFVTLSDSKPEVPSPIIR